MSLRFRATLKKFAEHPKLAPTEAMPNDSRAHDLRRSRLSLGRDAFVGLLLDRGALVVEDDPDLQAELAGMMTDLGARVVGASSGDSALALIGAWPLGLVLLDESLPGQSGLDVARRLRATDPDLIVIMMVERETPELLSAARSAGVTSVITKPVDAQTMIDALLETRRMVESSQELLAAE